MNTRWDEMKTRFSKAIKGEPFYAVISPDLEWIDSADSFDIAVHWVACHSNHFNLPLEEEYDLFNESEYYIIHSKFLPDLVNKEFVS